MSTVTFMFIKSLNLRFSTAMHMTYFEMLHKLLIGRALQQGCPAGHFGEFM